MGLPHNHILVWLTNKIHASQKDSFLSAEIPNKLIDPELYEIIIKQMIHGPCGRMNMNSPCMKNGKCTKHFPKEYWLETQTGEDGYPKCRRRRTTLYHEEKKRRIYNR